VLCSKAAAPSPATAKATYFPYTAGRWQLRQEYDCRDREGLKIGCSEQGTVPIVPVASPRAGAGSRVQQSSCCHTLLPQRSAGLSFVLPRNDSRSHLRLFCVTRFTDNCFYCHHAVVYMSLLLDCFVGSWFNTTFDTCLHYSVRASKGQPKRHIVRSCPASFPNSQKRLIKLTSH